jgi:hypothetical protein
VFEAVSGFEPAHHQREVVRIQPAQVPVELGGDHRGGELWISQVHERRSYEPDRRGSGHEWSGETKGKPASDQSCGGDDSGGAKHCS